MSEPVRVEKRGHIMEVTLDRPKVNAIDLAASRALGAAFQELQDDPNLRVGIVTAAGDRIFSAGWDLKAAHQDEEVGKWWETTDYGPGGFAGLTELWGNGAVWAFLGAFSLMIALMPWLPPLRRVKPAAIDLDHCNGCARCAEAW